MSFCSGHHSDQFIQQHAVRSCNMAEELCGFYIFRLLRQSFYPSKKQDNVWTRSQAKPTFTVCRTLLNHYRLAKVEYTPIVV